MATLARMCGAGLAFKNPKNMCGWEIKGELLKKMIKGQLKKHHRNQILQDLILKFA